jgi:predicted Ser/Thr protein kinase
MTLVTLAVASIAQPTDPLSVLEFRGRQIFDNVPTDRVAYAVRQLNSTMLVMAYSGQFGSAGPSIRFRALSIERNETGILSQILAVRNYTDLTNVGNINSSLHMVNDQGDVALVYRNGLQMCIQNIVLRVPPGKQPPPGGIAPTSKFSEASFPHISTISYPTTQQAYFSIIFSKVGALNTCLHHQNAGFDGPRNLSQLMFCPIANAEMDPLAETTFDPLDLTSFFVINKAFLAGTTTFEVRKCSGVGTPTLSCAEILTGVSGIAVADPNIDMVASRAVGDKLWFAWRASNVVSIICVKFTSSYVVKASNTINTSNTADSFNLVDSLNDGGVALIINQAADILKYDYIWNDDNETIGVAGSSSKDVIGIESAGYPFALATDSLENSIFALVSTLNGGQVSLNYFAVPACGNTLVSPDFEECDQPMQNCNATCQCPLGAAEGGGCLGSGPVDIAPTVFQPSGNTAVEPPTMSNEELVRTVVPAVVVPVVVVAAGVALLVILLQRKKRSQKVKEDKIRLEPAPANYQAMPGANPILANDSKSSQASGDHTSIPVGLAPLNSMSSDERMKIPYSDLKVIREIGAGAYGKVFLGEWQMTQVALKVSGMTSSEEFIREAQLLINLRPHPNVVQILGVSTDGLNVVMIMEYCDGGSLDHLVKNEISMQTKIKYLSGIAKGVYHLHKNNIIHRDLAARNILLSRGEPKISDFGMSRKVQEAASHGQTRSTIGPLRWMAPESLKSSQYSSKSDVWSFGILCWEVLLGEEPHLNSDPLAIGIEIRDRGHTPTIPEDINPDLAQLMKDCWKLDADQRPDFAEICKRINRVDV